VTGLGNAGSRVARIPILQGEIVKDGVPDSLLDLELVGSYRGFAGLYFFEEPDYAYAEET
jgi:hypothetical protein